MQRQRGLEKFKETVLKNIQKINDQDEKGWTALHYAVHLKNSDAVDILIEHGIDTSLKDKKGKKAMDLKWW